MILLVCLSLVQPEYSGLPPEVAHFNQSDASDQNLLFYFEVPVCCPTSHQWIFAYVWGLRKGIETVKSHSFQSAMFD